MFAAVGEDGKYWIFCPRAKAALAWKRMRVHSISKCQLILFCLVFLKIFFDFFMEFCSHNFFVRELTLSRMEEKESPLRF